MFRLARALLLAAVALSMAPAAASAVPAHQDSAYLGALWTKVFETPSAQNPFGTGDSTSGCFELGHTVAPLGPNGVASCTVSPGTGLFEVGSSFECSSFPGDHGTFGTTFQELLTCARQSDVQVAPIVTLDGSTVSLSEVQTGPLNIVLPADNILGLPAGSTGLSAAHGWVALLHPLTPGMHTIVIKTGTSIITTMIIVSPRS
jgi:hypothetical protein